MDDKKTEQTEGKMMALQQELSKLENQISELKTEVKKANDKLEKNLLKQIEILSVFVAIISLIITNVIGIDAFGSLGLRGLAQINLLFVFSAFVLLMSVKWIIIGSK